MTALLCATSSLAHAQESPDARLFAAIASEDIPSAKAAIAAGASFSAYDRQGHTPLTAAAEQGNDKLFQVLLDAGAPLDALDRRHETALIAATRGSQVDIAWTLVEHRADLNLQDASGRSAVFYNGNSHDICELLIANGASLAVVDDAGHTPLGEAAATGNFTLMEDLKSHGGTYASPTDALYGAAVFNDLTAMKAALAQGANPNAHPRYDMTPLMAAARAGNTEAVRLLLAQHVDLNADDGNKQTALFWAMTSQHLSTMNALLDAGADIVTPINGQRTMLQFAATWFDDPALIHRLLPPAVDVNHTDIFHETALIDAARRGHSRDVAALLAAGADPTVRNQHNATAADAARQQARDEPLARLLDNAARSWTTAHAAHP
jgi:ankyrin repeat protein